jgi:hypothetical protein
MLKVLARSVLGGVELPKDQCDINMLSTLQPIRIHHRQKSDFPALSHQPFIQLVGSSISNYKNHELE